MGMGMVGCVNVDLDWLRFLDESDAYYRAVFELVVVRVVVQLLLVTLDMGVIVADFDDGNCRVAGVRGGRGGARVGAGVGGPAAVAEGGVLEPFGAFVAGVDAFCLESVSPSHGLEKKKHTTNDLQKCKNGQGHQKQRNELAKRGRVVLRVAVVTALDPVLELVRLGEERRSGGDEPLRQIYPPAQPKDVHGRNRNSPRRERDTSQQIQPKDGIEKPLDAEEKRKDPLEPRNELLPLSVVAHPAPDDPPQTYADGDDVEHEHDYVVRPAVDLAGEEGISRA